MRDVSVAASMIGPLFHPFHFKISPTIAGADTAVFTRDLRMSHSVPAQSRFELPRHFTEMVKGFSAPFASWMLHVPGRILFDAGEGITPFLGNRVFLPEAIFLTHSHLDHVSGLLSFLSARRSMRGPTDKPLAIYYPVEGESEFVQIKEHIFRHLRDASFTSWNGLEDGDRVAIRHWIVEAFMTFHGIPSLGYRILEKRTKLKPEYVGNTPDVLQAIRESGQDLQTTQEHVTFAITGDTGPGIQSTLIQNADWLMHECTFLDIADRHGIFHASCRDAFELALSAKVKRLVLYHFSQRYTKQQIEDSIQHECSASGFKGEVYCVAGYTELPTWY